jgi:transcriptional regulator with XRE-family HTH domain
MLRHQKGVSQAALGDAVGLTAAMICKYEAGVSRVPSGTLLDICRTLDISVSFFMQGIEPVKEIESEKADLLFDMCSMFPRLLVEDQRLLVRYVQQMLEGDRDAAIYLPDRLGEGIHSRPSGGPDKPHGRRPPDIREDP